MKKILTVILALCMLAGTGGCGKAEALLPESEYFVEYGERYTVRPDTEFDVTVTDENGDAVAGVRNGAFTPEVGEYTAVYSSKDGKRKQTVKIVCRDTVAPRVDFAVFAADVTVGTRVFVPEYAVNDYSGIKSQSVTVLRPDGAEQAVVDGAWTTEAGRYTIRVEAEDSYGNKTVKDVYITAREEWVDNAAAANVLYSFDSDEYLNLVYGSADRESFRTDIVREGYPAIDGESDGNGVLRLSTEYNYGNVYAHFALHTGFTASTAGTIRFRLAADRGVDYVKLMLSDGTYFGKAMLVEKDRWLDLEVDPIDYGFGNTFTDFYLVARADRGLTLWIDEITYDARWTDAALSENVLADFDEPEYVGNVYQNLYSNVTYASAGGSRFSIVDYPNDLSRKVLKVETTQDMGGFTYMFDEPINVSEISSLIISIDCVYDCKNLWLGFMLGDYRAGGAAGVQNWYDTTAYPDGAPWNGNFDNLGEVDELRDLTVPASSLQARTEYVTGIFIGVIDRYRTGNVLYIDEIRIEK